MATFNDLKLIKAAQGYTLTATVTGLPTVTSAAFNITPAAPATASFTTQPSTMPSDSAITPAVQVTVLDAYGNPVTTTAVSLALGANPGNDMLRGSRW